MNNNCFQLYTYSQDLYYIHQTAKFSFSVKLRTIHNETRGVALKLGSLSPITEISIPNASLHVQNPNQVKITDTEVTMQYQFYLDVSRPLSFDDNGRMDGCFSLIFCLNESYILNIFLITFFLP